MYLDGELSVKRPNCMFDECPIPDRCDHHAACQHKGDRSISRALEAILNYQQADMDGIIVTTSRQAIHEVAESYETIHDLLIRCLPYIECAENDPHYKQCGVKKLRDDIMKALDL